MPSLTSRLAVCSWSLQPVSADDLLAKLKQTGLARIQCALKPLRENVDGAWTGFAEKCAGGGVQLVSGMIETIGEDYSTLESIKRTGGVVPDEHWEQNWRNIQRDVEIARGLGLKLIAFHAGFLPHHEKDPAFAKLLDRISRIADLCAENRIALGFETGQETADTLGQFLTKLGRPSDRVGVNFDPANMILYAKGDPIDALRTLGRWLLQCHIKDAVETKTPGTWGQEVTVGSGQVDWRAFFTVLDELGFEGDCCLEREAGDQRVADLRAGREFLERLGV